MSNDHWNTPPEIVELVEAVLGDISLDPCSNPGSVVGAHANKYPSDSWDGLTGDWAEVRTHDGYYLWPNNAFVNPPYSNAGPWLKRCAYWGCRLPVIALVNVCTGTTYWAAHVWPHAAAICFPKGRIAFLRDGKPVKGNRYEQALILYSDSLAVRERFVNTMSKLGQVVLPVRGEAA